MTIADYSIQFRTPTPTPHLPSASTLSSCAWVCVLWGGGSLTFISPQNNTHNDGISVLAGNQSVCGETSVFDLYHELLYCAVEISYWTYRPVLSAGYAFVFTLFLQVKAENPPLLFCILICRFLSSHSTKPSLAMHVFVVCVCVCVCVCVRACVSECVSACVSACVCMDVLSNFNMYMDIYL